VASPSEASPGARRVLVTGLGGFTGRHLAAELAQAGYEVVGLGATAADPAATLDLCDKPALQAWIATQQLDAVIHLAAIAFVAHGDVDAIYRTNVVGTRNLLEALAEAPTTPRVVVLASSANIYGNALVEPITEDTPASPMNDYAVSKLAMEYMARLWSERLPLVILRPFNYTGVGQGAQYLIPKIVAHYRQGARAIELGNIDVVRDFLDVRDVASIYRQLLDTAPIGATFNACSGRGHSLAEVIDMLAELAGYRIDITVNPAFVRANEVKRLVGSRERLAQALGGLSTRPLQETLRWMYQAP
jgi:nucleoside-diphosphate-sugar epimerase